MDDNTKPRILVFTSWYLPGFKAGGPLQSIANLVDHIGDEFSFRIVTGDRDAGDARPYPNIRTGTWQQVGDAQVCYLSPELQRFRPVARLMRDTQHDVLYLNSFFDPRFTTLPLLARRLGLAPRSPAILAPRGEFSAGAYALKTNKKRLFTAASRAIGLHSGLIWQASSEHEAADIRRIVGRVAQDIRIASNLPRRVPATKMMSRRDPGDPLRVVFLSRISPKKNLLFALEVLAQLSVPVTFSVYGPKEDTGYWHRCEDAIKALPPNVRADYCGPVVPAQVIATLSGHDLFFLPTLGENYGHVIAEAFQAGLPVLLSDQTPWRGLQQAGIGADLPLGDPSPFGQYIENFAKKPPDEQEVMQRNVAKRAAEIADVSQDLCANRDLFNLV